MQIKEILSKDYKLPPFSSYRQSFFKSLFLVLLPNIFFWLVAWYQGLARPIVNMDYLLPVLVFAAPFPWKIGKILGALLLIAAIAVDFAMFALQLFPFMDLAAIRYLLPFILIAPVRYLVFIGIILLYMLVFPFILNRAARSTSFGCVTFWVLVFGLFGYVFSENLKYHDTAGLRFGRANHYVIHSQAELYWYEMADDWLQQIKSQVPTLSPYPAENASHHFKQPYSDKMLLIVADSWGRARKDNVQRSILQNIYNQKDNLEFIEEGFFDFSGATVQGEMRELCTFKVENGYAFSKLPVGTFSECLPNKLKKLGYETFGMHGASSQLYDRASWYPAVGFQKNVFGEALIAMPRCDAFNGACDSALHQVVADRFKETGNKKSFVYWMTLTSHVPYARKDIHDNRFDCEKLEIPKGDICNNMSLEAQFFDDLGELIKRPEMKGVEVVVVGDHMPPIMDKVPTQQYLHWNDVSWLHFKVKP